MREPDVSALIPCFLGEVSDQLGALERDLTALTSASDPGPLIDRLFRALHTIKGSALCLSLTNLAEAAHAAESILEPWHAARCAPTDDALDALQRALCAVNDLCESITRGASPTPAPDRASGPIPLHHVLQHQADLARMRAATAGRQIELTIAVPGSILVDPSVARSLASVLLHTLNNCIDHAAQPAVQRAAAGKTATTSIRMSVEPVPPRSLLITVSDDGPGLDRTAIAREAADLGLSALDGAGEFDDQRLQELVLHPGLSTVGTPTIHTGRGFGLNAARLAIADCGGSIRVLSRPGRGTTFSFLVPLLNPPSASTDTGSESVGAA